MKVSMTYLGYKISSFSVEGALYDFVAFRGRKSFDSNTMTLTYGDTELKVEDAPRVKVQLYSGKKMTDSFSVKFEQAFKEFAKEGWEIEYYSSDSLIFFREIEIPFSPTIKIQVIIYL